MRLIVTALAVAGLAGCNQQNATEEPDQPAKPAALTYEGGGYKTDAAKIAHGKRLATVLDCTGCHGDNLQGSDVGSPKDGAMWTPNITLVLDRYDDSGLEKLIRHGITHDRREFWFMPVESYQFLTDRDMAALIAYLRTFKPAGRPTPRFEKNKSLQKEIADGVIGNAEVQIAKFRKEQPVDLGTRHALGRYVAQTTCSGCHNNALQGWGGFTPSLDVAGAYSKAELTRLLTTGEGKARKDLGMMSGIARNSFSKLTPREREAVVDYVLARANRPPPVQ
jgi:mono/diheme cytochrome c family protein